MGRIFVSLAMIGLVFVFWHESSTYPATAARLPDLIGWLVMMLAIMAIGEVLLGWRRQSVVGRLELFPQQDWRGLAVGAGFLGLIVLYAWSITEVGYLIATPLFMLIPFIVLRPIGWITAIITTAAVTAFIWVVFVWFLNLSIPLYPAI